MSKASLIASLEPVWFGFSERSVDVEKQRVRDSLASSSRKGRESVAPAAREDRLGVETLLTVTQGGVHRGAPAPARCPAPALSAVRRSGAERSDRRANCLQRCAPSGSKRLISRDDRPLNPGRFLFLELEMVLGCLCFKLFCNAFSQNT